MKTGRCSERTQEGSISRDSNFVTAQSQTKDLMHIIRMWMSTHSLKNLNLTILRNDGIILCTSNDSNQEAQQLGALSAGLWQAAKAIQDKGDDNQDKDFILQFSSPSSGMSLYPIILSNKNEELLLLLQYGNLENPAKLKYEVKNLAFKISETLNLSKAQIKENNENKKNREDFLFSHISDKEMDNLFNQLE